MVKARLSLSLKNSLKPYFAETLHLGLIVQFLRPFRLKALVKGVPVMYAALLLQAL